MKLKKLGISLVVLIALAGSVALAGGPRITSSSGILPGVKSHEGFNIVPARGAPNRVYTEDLAPVQVFEIIRPNQSPFSVKRIMSSCSCLDVSMDDRDFGRGERAFIEVRNVKPTQPEGATYAFFIEIDRPFRQTLQYDVFVRSERRHSAPPPPHQQPGYRPEPQRHPEPPRQPEPPRRVEPQRPPQPRHQPTPPPPGREPEKPGVTINIPFLGNNRK